jgi:hypothetical protein
MIMLQTLARTSGPTRDTNAALMPEMSLSFTLLKTAPILIMFSGVFSNSNSNQGGTFDCVIDGQPDLEMRRIVQFGGAANPYVVSMQKLVYLTPCTHLVEVWWVASANTLTNAGIQRSLTIIEEEL